MKPYLEKGYIFRTPSGEPMYELTQDVYAKDSIDACHFKEIGDWPKPETGAQIPIQLSICLSKIQEDKR